MSEPLVVIGITGVARSGKDTVARMLCHPLHNFTRVALGDGVRGKYRDADIATSYSIGKELSAAGRDERWALQRIGTEAREAVARAAAATEYDLFESAVIEEAVNRAWAYVALFEIEYLRSIHPDRRNRFAIPDVSYLHEINAFRDVIGVWGGTYRTWRVEREGAGLDGEAGAHSSEVGRATIPADETIIWDGDVEDLTRKVDRLVGLAVGL